MLVMITSSHLEEKYISCNDISMSSDKPEWLAKASSLAYPKNITIETFLFSNNRLLFMNKAHSKHYEGEMKQHKQEPQLL